MLDFISQAGVFLFGASSAFLVTKNNKWGFVHGLISQFFLILTAQMNRQIGVFLLALIEAAVWSYGIYRIFLKAKKVNFS